MMVFSVPISLKIPLELPDVYLMENSPFSIADLISAGSSSIDQKIETSVLLTKVEELFEGHVQPLIGKFRKWGCDASPTFKYWDMFLVAVQIMLLNIRAEREGSYIIAASPTPVYECRDKQNL
jgi:hypothetical protein